MMPSFDLFGIQISSYWTMCAIGMFLIFVLCILRNQKYGFSLWKAIILAISIDIFGIAGVLLLGFLQGGFTFGNYSFMGALLFTPILVALIGLVLRVDVIKAVAFSALPICAMGACMKVGCFLSGCCEGIVLNGDRVPVQLIESGISLVIFVVLLVLEQKTQNLRILFPCYMLFYAATRFPIEYLRNTPKDLFGMSAGQVTAAVVFLLGLAAFVLIVKFSKRSEEMTF